MSNPTKKPMIPAHIRAEYLKFIDNRKDIPQHLRLLMRRRIKAAFTELGQVLGAIHLSYVRGEQKDDKQLNELVALLPVRDE
jgi:hypothetical protein